MSNPPELPEYTRDFIAGLDKEDIETLARIIAVFRKAQGWCAINRWLFRGVFFGVVGIIILTSQGIDAIKNLFQFFRSH